MSVVYKSPEELFGGQGNRWDNYSRSDRFMSTINTLLESISRLVKQIVCKYTGISTVSISFNIDTSALSASFDTKNRLSLIAEKLADLGRVLESFKTIVENEYVQPGKGYEYLKDQCYAIDEKLGDILIANLGQVGSGNDGEDMGGEDMGDDGGFDL